MFITILVLHYIFLFARGIPYALFAGQSLVSNLMISFHRIVHIVAFYMINETVCVSVYNFAFFAIQRWHVLVMKFVQADFRHVQYAHAHVKTACRTSSRVCAFRRRLDSPQRIHTAAVKIQFHDHCLRVIFIHIVINFMSTWLRTFSIFILSYIAFINLYKFFLKSFFARVWNCVLSSM